MADLEASQISHTNMNHILLDQPLLRLPYELIRKNFRLAHFAIEKESVGVKALLKETATASLNGRSTPEDVLKNLDQMLGKMRGLKRKLSDFAQEEERLHEAVNLRMAHLRELSDMHTVEDVKYEAWSRRRLDRLLVDYLLRLGYNDSAIALAEERQMQGLVDIDTFVAMTNIRKSLEQGSLTEALAFCQENKKELRKLNNNLEFMLRFQQYVEMVRTGSATKMTEAIAYAKKWLAPQKAIHPDLVSQVAGMLAYTADTDVEPYATLYSPSRWVYLADLFVKSYNHLLGLTPDPVLHIALSSGLSALKTPACHSSVPSSNTSSASVGNGSGGPSVCPICSTELNGLARSVPYAYHSKSHVDNDLVRLPNGRVFSQAKLNEHAGKAGLEAGVVKDLHSGEVFQRELLRRVFIT